MNTLSRELLPAEKHLPNLTRAQALLAVKGADKFDSLDPLLAILSVSLASIYDAATCARGCRGGPHILEAPFGRAYNLAAGAWGLINVAQYDEALNLIRGIGEIHNLLLLFALEPQLISRWLSSSKRERLTQFSPVKVRIKLEAHGPFTLGGEDWYSALSERFVHVHPEIRPNQHTSGSTGWLGPVEQRAGAEHAIAELQTVVFSVALAACKWFGFDDLAKELGQLIDKIPVSE